MLWTRYSGCSVSFEKNTKPRNISSLLHMSLEGSRFLLMLLSHPCSCLGLFHLAKNSVVKDDLKMMHAVLNFGASRSAMLTIEHFF